MSFSLLSEPIRKYIYDKGWEELRAIQVAAIDKILSTDGHYILASRTASGKTEAAFLPILSKVDFNEIGVQVLCISPLIALINDQFYRVEELCQYLDVTVTKWHGEANLSAKNRLLKQPSGIVLITPESLEAMFVNKPFNAKQLFSNLKFIVIDEIHAFIGTDRGTQLKSILFRLQKLSSSSFRIIGLSATIGDYQEAKKFTGNIDKTKVLLDNTKKEVKVQFKYFQQDSNDLPLELLQDLYHNTKDDKVLIFPNSRRLTEEIAVKLKKLANKLGGHNNYFSHHSAVDREIREETEFFAKNNRYENFMIACTSTLELGIDIGTVNKVVQINATHSIASLIQRIGRSGRKENEISQLILYSIDSWGLLQSLACWLLYLDGYIEPPHIVEKPYDILLHQALAITKQYSGLTINNLIDLLKNNFAFKNITENEIREIIEFSIKTEILEKIRQEVIIGIEGEKIVNSRDFYSVFKTEINFKVINLSNKIGEIPFSPQIQENENILLAAKIWKITHIDFEAKKIEVITAHDGKKPIFFGNSAAIHRKIREKMLEILYSKNNFDFLDDNSSCKLEELRRDFAIINIKSLENDRPLFVKENSLELFTFTGTRINRSISVLFNLAEIQNSFDDKSSVFELQISKQELLNKWLLLSNFTNSVDIHLEGLLIENPSLINFSKWGQYLPLIFQISLLKQSYFDFIGTEYFLKDCHLLN